MKKLLTGVLKIALSALDFGSQNTHLLRVNSGFSTSSALKNLIFRTPLIISILFIGLSCSGHKNSFDASGTFETIEVIVSSEVNGKIIYLDIEEGSMVRAGELLGIIDTTQLYLNKVQLLAQMRATGSRRQDISKQIAATEQQIATQMREKTRTQNLIEANAANQKQLDDINSAIAVLEKQLAAQRSTLENSNRSISEESSALEVQVAQIEDKLLKSRITSPIDGTILVKYAEAGEVTAPGKALFKVADLEHMILRAYITSDQLTKVQLGQKVGVFADSGAKEYREYEGVITWISGTSEFTPKTIQTRNERANLVYAVKIAVKNDGYLKIGMYAEVKL